MTKHPKGTIIPLATTSECFNKKLHKVLHAGGNAWVKRVWDTLKDGAVWDYPTTSTEYGKVKLKKSEGLDAWVVV